jgi:benzoyl-CoA-dihydrodiol lyase
VTTLEHRSTATEGPATVVEPAATVEVSFQTSPERYRHWRPAVDREIATLTPDVDEDGGLVPCYELTLTS